MTPSDSPPAKKNAAPNPDFDKQISGLLQSIYGAVEQEGIPEKFLELLEKLDQAERTQSAPKDR